jgi:hypothetical protein
MQYPFTIVVLFSTAIASPALVGDYHLYNRNGLSGRTATVKALLKKGKRKL